MFIQYWKHKSVKSCVTLRSNWNATLTCKKEIDATGYSKNGILKVHQKKTINDLENGVNELIYKCIASILCDFINFFKWFFSGRSKHRSVFITKLVDIFWDLVGSHEFNQFSDGFMVRLVMTDSSVTATINVSL